MKCGMTIEYLKCRADLHFEVDFGVNGAIGAIVTKWDLILFGSWIVFFHNIIYFFNTLHVPLTKACECTRKKNNHNLSILQ